MTEGPGRIIELYNQELLAFVSQYGHRFETPYHAGLYYRKKFMQYIKEVNEADERYQEVKHTLNIIEKYHFLTNMYMDKDEE